MKKIIFIPGLANNEILWENQLKSLSYTPQIKLFVYTNTHLKSIKEVVKDLAKTYTGDLYIVGMSMGGYIALEFAKLYPERVKSLFLISTTAKEDNVIRKEIRQKQLKKIEEIGYEEVYKNFTRAVIPKGTTNYNEIEKKVNKMAEMIGAKGYHNQSKVIMSRNSYLQDLEHFKFPIYFAIGGKDKLMNAKENIKIMEEKVKKIKTILFKEAGHLIPLEYPAKLNTLLKEWIQDEKIN